MGKQPIDDGGSAFPRSSVFADAEQSIDCVDEGADGMSLRDYFAAKAMQALIASNDEGVGDRIEDVPQYAYQIADAMLEARKAVRR